MRLRNFVLFVSLLVPVGIQAQSNATLSGTLTDPSGAAVAGAEVTAQPLPDGNPIRVTTGADGRFALALAPGRYRVRIAHPSFARIEQEFTLAAGETRTWDAQARLERLSATVIVSAQAEPTAAETVSSPVTVLTHTDIEQRQALWLGPLLATTPSFVISRLGRDGGIATLFLNGGNSNFTKVLVDGVTLNEPGGAVDFSNFALDGVEKIEIVRGAESALHGSDAMAGVVQIFSHRGTTHRPVFDFGAEGGRFGTARGALRLSGLLGRFDYSAGAARFHTGGQGPNDSFRNTTLAGNFGWRFNDTNTVRLTVRSNASDAGIPGQTSLAPPDLNEHNAQRNITAGLAWDFSTGARWRHRLAGTETYIRQLFDDPASDFCSSSPPFVCDFPFTARNQFNRAGFAGQSSYVAARGGVTFGYQNEVENGSFSGTHGRRNNQAGYIEARYQFGARLGVVAGARAEANDSFGTRVVPRFGAAYALRLGSKPAAFWGATRVRGSIGAGIKEPSLAQSLAQDACFPGNTGLRPERSRAFSVGADQVLAGDRVRVSADFFHNRFRDIVSFAFGQFPGAPPAPALCPFGFGSFFNTDLARARGTNVAVESRVAKWLRVSGHYSYVDSKVLDSPNAFDPALQPGNRLLRRPVHSGSLVLNAGHRGLNVNFASVFVGERTDSDFLGFGLTRNPGYARFDLATSYELHRGVTAFGRVENLFDKKYEETLGFPAYRRSYRLGMRFTFGGE
jgi:outer membrane cobalamin receptor